MILLKYLLSIFAFFIVVFQSLGMERIKFNAKDGIEITADLYMEHPATEPFIILFHQAGWSRGEYREIAPKLNRMGFNCMAVDQRSGNSVNDVPNETYRNAKQAMKETQYLNALIDMKAAIEHARKFLAKGPVIIWGSSYSASLVLKIAGDYPDKVDAVLAFSPGEYFINFGKPGDFIAQAAFSIQVPVLITSAKSEKNNWWSIYEAIPGDKKTFYLPGNSSGNHGSKALWAKYNDSKGYWNAVGNFLTGLD